MLDDRERTPRIEPLPGWRLGGPLPGFASGFDSSLAGEYGVSVSGAGGPDRWRFMSRRDGSRNLSRRPRRRVADRGGAVQLRFPADGRFAPPLNGSIFGRTGEFMMNHVLALILLLAGDGDASGAPSPEEVSREWLRALAQHDSTTIRKLSTFPLVVDGFQSNGKPETNPCNGVPGMTRNRRTMEVRVSATSEDQFEKVIACVFSDNSTHEWTSEPDGRGEFKGTIKVLSGPERSSRRLARYRKEVSRLPKPRVLVEAVTTNDGVTLSALLVLRTVASGALVVEAVHTDFLFEE